MLSQFLGASTLSQAVALQLKGWCCQMRLRKERGKEEGKRGREERKGRKKMMHCSNARTLMVVGEENREEEYSQEHNEDNNEEENKYNIIERNEEKNESTVDHNEHCRKQKSA